MKKIADIHDDRNNRKGLIVEISEDELAKLAGFSGTYNNAADTFVRGPAGAVLDVGAIYGRASEINVAWDHLASDLGRAVNAVAKLQVAAKDAMPEPKPKPERPAR